MLSGFAKLRIIPWRFPVFTVHRENHRTLLCDHIDLPPPRIILHDDSFLRIKSNTLHAFLAEPFEFLPGQGSGHLLKRPCLAASNASWKRVELLSCAPDWSSNFKNWPRMWATCSVVVFARSAIRVMLITSLLLVCFRVSTITRATK